MEIGDYVTNMITPGSGRWRDGLKDRMMTYGRMMTNEQSEMLIRDQ